MKNNYAGSVVAVLIIIAGFITPTHTHAQTPCGSIIAPIDWNEPTLNIETTPITDCADPFHKTTVPASPYKLSNKGIIIHEGDTVSAPEGGANEYAVTGFPLLTGVAHAFFLHEGSDYRFIDTQPSTPQEADYRALAIEFLPAGTDIELFVAAMTNRSLTNDMDEATQNLFWDYTDYVDQNFHPQLPPLHAGTYTLVSKEYELQLVRETFLEKLVALLIPTAHAQMFREYIFTLTFTITEETPLTGISNILFLPGIQASRLYTTVDGAEERVWEPFGDDEVEKLRMTDTGESINDVYTKDIVDELPDGSNIYKGFIQYLNDIEGLFDGPLVETFPYDWRYDVFDIVENGTKVESGIVKAPLSSIKFLASTSPTDKVTIIAHSNGGILAKAIMLKLKEEGKENLVDKVIFIATPHIGTPKGLAALLHGYDQQHALGIVSTDEKVRSVMKNMPGAYGLLPSESYVSSLTEPMISFDDSDTTKKYRDAYGFTLTNMDEYSRFLNGIEGREDAGDRINEPSTANAGMLTTALLAHKEKLDTWTAPEGVEVFNIVGTGVPTPKSIEYKEFKENTCNADQSVCIPKEKIEGVLHFTRYGDKTVVSRSSVKSGGNVFVNLKKYNEEKAILLGYSHADIVETEAVQTLVDHLLHGSSTEGIDFVSTAEPTFSDDGLDIYTIHSPAHIFLRDNTGNVTGKTDVDGEWRSEIPGSDYFEAGGVKYVLVPTDRAYTVIIEGEENGIYTHSLATLTNETESMHHTYTATVTPTSIMQYTKTSAGEFSTVSIDKNGDGAIDQEMTLTGDIIEKEVTYDDLEDAIRGLKLSKKFERPLLVLVAQAEKLSHHHLKKHKKIHAEDVLLRVIEKQLEWYKRIGMVTEVQFKEIKDIIDKLIEK